MNVGVTVKVGVRVNVGGRWVATFSAVPDPDCVSVAVTFSSVLAVSVIAVSVSLSEVHATINANAPLSTINSAKSTPCRAQESYFRSYSILKG